MGETKKLSLENHSKYLRKTWHDPCEPALMSLTADSLTEERPGENDC